MITKTMVRNQLVAYLNQEVTLTELVEWVEWVMFEAEIAENDLATVRDIVARLGVADVQNFGLTWEDCTDFLRRLGYQPHIQAVPIAT